MADAQARPTFSVVVAVLDGAQTIERCLDSVYDQDGQVAEIVVMDAGSSDGTVEILERDSDRLAYWESQPDRGISHAWNKALPHVTGEWVLFLGADDRLAADRTLTDARELLDRLDPSVSIAYGRVETVDRDGHVTGTAGRPWGQAKADFYAYNTIPHQSVFHRASLFDQIGPFDESLRILGDYELLIRAVAEGPPEYIDLTVAAFATGGLSERPEMTYRATREAYRARYMNGLERLPDSVAPRVLRAKAFDIVRRVAGPDIARGLADRFHRRGGTRDGQGDN